jgi:hypothetical protein
VKVIYVKIIEVVVMAVVKVIYVKAIEVVVTVV